LALKRRPSLSVTRHTSIAASTASLFSYRLDNKRIRDGQHKCTRQKWIVWRSVSLMNLVMKFQGNQDNRSQKGEDHMQTLKMIWKTEQGRLVCRWVDFDNRDARETLNPASAQQRDVFTQHGLRSGTSRTVNAIQQT
jgi:hypothetical protein